MNFYHLESFLDLIDYNTVPEVSKCVGDPCGACPQIFGCHSDNTTILSMDLSNLQWNNSAISPQFYCTLDLYYLHSLNMSNMGIVYNASVQKPMFTGLCGLGFVVGLPNLQVLDWSNNPKLKGSASGAGISKLTMNLIDFHNTSVGECRLFHSLWNATKLF